MNHEMIVFVSTTSSTRSPLRSDSVHLALDFLHARRLAGLGTDFFQHVVEFGGGLPAAQFGRKQIGYGLRFEQASRFRFLGERVRQIQLDRNAHTASVAEGDRSESHERLIHTDTHPTFVPRAGTSKHWWSAKVKRGGAR